MHNSGTNVDVPHNNILFGKQEYTVTKADGSGRSNNFRGVTHRWMQLWMLVSCATPLLHWAVYIQIHPQIGMIGHTPDRLMESYMISPPSHAKIS